MQAVNEKAKKIKLLILDVDGVLTNGLIHYGTANLELKSFNIYDGMGIKLLQKSGVMVAVISGKTSEAVVKRLKELDIQHTYLGNENKLPLYEELKTKLKLTDNEIAYMGDDLPDLPLLRRAGFAITVPQAPGVIKDHADFVTATKAGKGAVREVCEHIMRAQNTYEAVIQCYLSE